MAGLSKEEEEWVEESVERGFTGLEMKKKLQESRYPYEKIDQMIELYEKLVRKDEVKLPERDEVDEKKFEKQVFMYKDKKQRKGMRRGEQKEAKRFLKSVESYTNTMKVATIGFKKEIDYMLQKGWNSEKVEKEMGYLKVEMIKRIVESKELLEIEHPKTGEEVNEENLRSLTVDELIELMEENVDTLKTIVDGKIV